jgi:hypothetical protein
MGITVGEEAPTVLNMLLAKTKQSSIYIVQMDKSNLNVKIL